MDSSGPTTQFTMEQVKQHNREDDAWIVIEGFVHDITPFMYDHPGGKDIMLNYLGQDASEIFVDEKEHNHSESAFSILKRYRIGVLAGSTPKDRTTALKQQMQTLLNFNKALVPQIPLLGKKYNVWIHSNIGLKDIIIFSNNFLEGCSRYPWWYIFIMWPPAIFWWLCVSTKEAGPVTTLSMFVMGLLFWTSVEYILHRFVFHVLTETTNWNLFHFFAHGIHHLTPNDTSRLTFPPAFSAVLGFLVYMGATAAFTSSSGVHAFLSGFGTGFMLYDAIHYYFHHGEAEWMPQCLKDMKAAHLNHHYKDDSTNFGVTTPIFDYMFGTISRVKTA
eukprot:TRINITY_DN1871_c0_g1_i2.p1 TRINITY_DN1871_c0_g1~~TRINITY_DN1871_c0_g1_i2.p1  ORF type:complete len:332 (-),score=23.04 TRINITY_DN1871_c0_g1_i2:148-1143(-)